MNVGPDFSYRVGFRADDSDPVQRELDELYRYGADFTTRVLHRSRMNLFSLLMRDLMATGLVNQFGRALDIGCNAGAYSRMISELGFDSVLGIDVDIEAIERARAAFASESSPGVRFEARSAEEIDAKGVYDLVLCTEVIEHTREPTRVVHAIKAAVSPGGVVVVSLPNRISLPYLLHYLSYRLHARPLDSEFREHLAYPFYRSLRLFDDPNLRRVATSGTNLIFDTFVLKHVHHRQWFPRLNEANFRLSRKWPLKYASQFFFIALKQRP